MTKFIMMIGVAGSGKSYWAEHYAKIHNAIVVSSDAIRKELYGDENDQTHNQEVFAEVHKRIFLAIKEGKNCIYDAMNIKAKYRKGFLGQLPKNVEKWAILVATDYDTILMQNQNRERHVPEEVIERAYKNLQMPDYSEGWNKIIYRPNSKKAILFTALNDCYNFDQENPHHTETLDKHLFNAAQYVLEHAGDYNMTYKDLSLVYIAAMFHDIGKPICKTYEVYNKKKTPDGYAHYYNHANVSAYLIACNIINLPKEDIADWEIIIYLVQHHMDRYADENFLDKIEKSKCKRIRNMLQLLNEADVNAH